MHDNETFDKFTEQARRVLVYAQEEAQGFQHHYVGTEHLLLGLLREGDSIAAKVLNDLGVKLGKARSVIAFIIGRGDRIVLGEIGLVPRAKKAIQLAVDEAHLLNHDYVGTEHLLLGLIRDREGIAVGALESLGVNLEKVRTQTLLALSPSSLVTEPPTAPIPASIPQDAAAPIAEKDLGLTHNEEGKKQINGMQKYIDELDNFTKQAKKVLVYAQEEAQSFQHHYVGTEHLLLGLIHEPEDIAVKVLTNLGIELKQVRSAVEFMIGQGEHIGLREIELTPRAKKAVELAVDEAHRLNHDYIGPEHLLLGLVREGAGIAAGVLESLGVNLEKVRRQTIHIKSGQ